MAALTRLLRQKDTVGGITVLMPSKTLIIAAAADNPSAASDCQQQPHLSSIQCFKLLHCTACHSYPVVTTHSCYYWTLAFLNPLTSWDSVGLFLRSFGGAESLSTNLLLVIIAIAVLSSQSYFRTQAIAR